MSVVEWGVTGMGVVDTVERIRCTDVAAADRAAVEAVLADVGRVRGWLDGVEIRAAARLEDLAVACPAVFAEQVLAGRGRLGDGERVTRRATTVALLPGLGGLLDAGATTAAHLDAVGEFARDIGPPRPTHPNRRRARPVTPSTSGHLVAGLDRPHHRDDLPARPMGPRTRSGPARPLDTTIHTLFADTVPDDCPTHDPGLNNDHLRAVALLTLTEGGRVGGPSRPEISIIVDYETLCHGLHQRSIIDTGQPIDLPVETLRKWACQGDLYPFILGTDGVVLDAGRRTRLATADQRRALKVIYPTCAIDGCTVKGSHCEPHHIRWWRNHGDTDLNNLIPLCSRHHHAVHDHGWQLSLQPGTRILTITYPDGTTHTSQPPRARAPTRAA